MCVARRSLLGVCEQWSAGISASGKQYMSKVKPLDLAPFDASDYLDSEELIAEYLAVALADPDPSAFFAAVRDVAKARGMAQVAADAGLGRESLYKTLRPGAQPRFDTVRHVLDALGVRLSVARMEPKPGP
jgi:probable addiction module antidote protein